MIFDKIRRKGCGIKSFSEKKRNRPIHGIIIIIILSEIQLKGIEVQQVSQNSSAPKQA